MVDGEASRPKPDAVRRVACIGAGVIGAGWAAHFLARGYEVSAWDPAADAERRLFETVEAAWPWLEELGLAPGAEISRLDFGASPEAAVAAADFVQESAPERLDLKIELLARLDAATPGDIVIASSTSGFSISEMQAGSKNRGRLVVGHPFNPPYLIPLVEVAGGTASEAGALAWAEAFYRSAGKEVIRMRREVPGFIANRLQQALWHEALHMIANGEATVAEIDRSITSGPGLRWASMGPCLTFHLAGGEGGMAHMLDHFEPELAAAWTRLDAPALTPGLRQAVIDGCDAAAGGRSVADLVRQRDRALVAIMRSLEAARAAE